MGKKKKKTKGKVQRSTQPGISRTKGRGKGKSARVARKEQGDGVSPS